MDPTKTEIICALVIVSPIIVTVLACACKDVVEKLKTWRAWLLDFMMTSLTVLYIALVLWALVVLARSAVNL